MLIGRGPGADWHVKLLILLAVEGSTLGRYSQGDELLALGKFDRVEKLPVPRQDSPNSCTNGSTDYRVLPFLASSRRSGRLWLCGTWHQACQVKTITQPNPAELS